MSYANIVLSGRRQRLPRSQTSLGYRWRLCPRLCTGRMQPDVQATCHTSRPPAVLEGRAWAGISWRVDNGGTGSRLAGAGGLSAGTWETNLVPLIQQAAWRAVVAVQRPVRAGRGLVRAGQGTSLTGAAGPKIPKPYSLPQGFSSWNVSRSIGRFQRDGRPGSQLDKNSVRLLGSVDATCIPICGCVDGHPAFPFACPTGVISPWQAIDRTATSFHVRHPLEFRL